MTPLLSACRATPAQDKLIYGLTLSPSSFDPHVGASSELGIPLTSVYDPLVWLSPDGQFVPGLAEQWQISDDGQTYTFALRRKVKFHDGMPFNAEAVCFNLEHIADPKTKSAKAASLLGPYAGCRTIDEFTAQISFKKPYAPFLSAASQVYLAMASPAAIKQWGDDYQFHQVGTGPFKFKDYVPKDHLTLVRNPDYAWAPDFFEQQGSPRLAEIEFRFYVDPATRALALEAGEVDVMGEIPPIDAARLVALHGNAGDRFQLLAVSIPGQPLQFYLNTARPPTNDLRVRRALLYAVDRQAIAQTVFIDYSPVAYGPLCRATWGYDSSVETLYPYDPVQAAQLLDQAGWQDSDGDGIRDKDGQPLVLETMLMSWGFVPEVGQMVQNQLQQAGIRLNLHLLAYPAAVQAAAEDQYHLIPFTFSGGDPHILYTSFHSSNAAGGFNWAKIQDIELDAWLEQGMQTTSAPGSPEAAERARIYAQIQQQIMAQALILPIRDYVNLNVASARVKGLRYDAQGWFPLLYGVTLE